MTSKLNKVRVISVSSGKGGVGKSNFTLALGLALISLGKKVLVWDADLGLSNIDILLNLKAKYNINDFLNGKKSLNDILCIGPKGLKILPGGSGLSALNKITKNEQKRLLSEFNNWPVAIDYLLIDTAAGIGSNVLYFNIAAPERIIVFTPEPTSVTDAYALMKVLNLEHKLKSFYLLPNRVKNSAEAKNVFNLISTVMEDNLPEVSLKALGFLPEDKLVAEAVKEQKSFFLKNSQASVSKHVLSIAENLIKTSPEESGGLNFFFNRLIS